MSAKPERVKVKVRGVYRQQNEETVIAQHFVLLQDDRSRRMPIWIGQCEALAITLGLEGKTGQSPEAPFTHDAMLLCLTAAGATVEEAYINSLRDQTFYATITLRVGDNVQVVDTRPSDAVALALRAGCPIYISEEVLQETISQSNETK